jgi:hypothetical protein
LKKQKFKNIDGYGRCEPALALKISEEKQEEVVDGESVNEDPTADKKEDSAAYLCRYFRFTYKNE